MATNLVDHTSAPAKGSENTLVSYLRRPAVLLSLTSATTFLVYLSTLSFGFVWDDHMQVESNPLVLSWKTLPRAFQSNLWFQVVPEGSYYRPFFIVWSVLNHSLFGLHPWGWHLTNVLLHILATCLVFVLLRRLKVEYWTAAIATMVFALHPVHIEPVAWVSAGSDTLAAILYMLAFLAFLRARDCHGRQKWAWSVASWGVFACALLTKEMALTLPIMVVAYLWFFSGKGGRAISRLGAAILASVPYGVLNLLYLAQRMRVLHGMAHFNRGYDAASTLLTLPGVLLTYARVLVFPKGLNGFYYHPLIHHLSFARVILPLAVLVGITVLVWWWSKREHDSLIAFFGLWIPLCLVPVLYLPTFMPGDFARDRYLYLPSIGFAFLLARAIRQLPVAEAGRQRSLFQAGAVAILLAAFAAGVLSQQIYWADDLLVFYRGHQLYPQNPTAAMYLGADLNWRGDPVSALPLLQQAIRLNPREYFSHWVLAIVNSELHRDQEAKQELATAVAIAPQYYLHSADGLTNLGIAQGALHEYAAAENSLRQAVQMEPNSNSSLLYLGLVLLRTNRPDEAAPYLEKAAAIYPAGYNIHFALGLLAQVRGDRAKAAEQYRTELQFHPDNNRAKMSLSALNVSQQSSMQRR